MKLTLLNRNISLDVVQFNSTAIAFNSDFTVNIQATTPELLGEVSNVFITLNTDEGSEILRGIITEFSFYISHLNGYCYHFIVQSLLFPFSVDLHTRVYRNMTAEDILRKVLVSAKFDVSVDLKDALAVLPQIVQYKETDLTFVLRLMSYYGLLGKFEVKGKTCVYRIAYRLSAFDIGACPNFPYAPHSKAHAAPVMFSYLQKTELKPSHFVFTEFDATQPNQSFKLETISNSPLPSCGEIRVHGLGRFDADTRNQLAQTWQTALDASRTHLTVTIDEPCIFLGNTLTVSGNRAGPTPAKKYRLIEQTHYYDKEGYRQICRLHPVNEAYYKMPIISPVSAGILTASVHSKNDDNNPYDEYGRYNVIFDVDETKFPSLLLHAMQPSVGSTGGFHFPYRAETAVLVQSFGNDAQDAVILGAMHQDNQPSLVTSKNAGQHILTSKGNQTLLMDDDNAVFSLNDLSSSFLMDASDAPTMALSTEGLMTLSATSGILERVKANSNYAVSKDHVQTVQDNVNKVSHHHQEVSGKDMMKKMKNMELRSEKNIDLKTGERFAVSVNNAQLEGDKLLLFTEQGTLSVHSSGGLKFSSGKGVSISQAGASFVMDDAGNTNVVGKHTITLNFNDASLTGEKVYLGGNNHLNASLPDKPRLIYPYLISKNPLTWDQFPMVNEVFSLPYAPKTSDPADMVYPVQLSGAEAFEINGKKLSFPSNQFNTTLQDHQHATAEHAPVTEGNLVLNAKQLFPPVILDWNETEKNENTKPLSDAQIQYFKTQGNNAFIFVHGYNVESGAFGEQITNIEFSATPALAEGMEMGATGFVRATTSNAPQTIARTQTQLAKLYPAFQEALNVKAVLPDCLQEAGTLNGTGAHNWLIHMEDDLNRATGQFDGSDYTKYQRIIGVCWHGQVGTAPLSDVTFPLSEQEADNPMLIQNFCHLLLQLHRAGITINLMAHSLGNRVVLNTLQTLGTKGYASVVDHVFMWEAAVANNALSTKEGAPYCNAASATKKITVLYNRADSVLKDDYSFDKVMGQSLANIGQAKLQEAEWMSRTVVTPIKTVPISKPALGLTGVTDLAIQKTLTGKLIQADMTSWVTPQDDNHSYMKMPNKNVMIHGYQTFIINRNDWGINFGKYDKSLFPDYPLPKDEFGKKE
jgi:uncharacterized protein involved in type VI secretion and phage assembly